jgi:hypothetical protein
VPSWAAFVAGAGVFVGVNDPAGCRPVRRAADGDADLARLAFTALAMLPALGAFVFAERYIVAGAAGAVTG